MDELFFSPQYFILIIAFLSLILQMLFAKNILINPRLFYFVFALSIVYFLVAYIFFTTTQQKLWSESEFTKKFLPPYTSYYYLLQYHFFRFLLYHLISLIVSMVFWFLGHRLNKKNNNIFFFDDELPLAATFITLFGSPFFSYSWMLYPLLVTALYLVSQAILIIKARISLGKFETINNLPRLSFRFFWAPAAILVILIEYLIK